VDRVLAATDVDRREDVEGRARSRIVPPVPSPSRVNQVDLAVGAVGANGLLDEGPVLLVVLLRDLLESHLDPSILEGWGGSEGAPPVRAPGLLGLILLAVEMVLGEPRLVDSPT